MKKEKTIIIGAGGAGKELIEEIINNDKLYNYDVIGFIDDDKRKINTTIRGIKVIGNIEEIPNIIKSFNILTILIAIPSSSGELIRKIYSICSKYPVKIKIIPRLSEIISGRVNYNQIKEISVEDLLGRSVIKQEFSEISKIMKNEIIVITGAAGSIGTELSKQCLILNPKKIICFDIWENGIFYLQDKLEKLQKTLNKTNNTEIIYHIGNICDQKKVEYIFNKYKPSSVFHAAAYKHVPLMEINIDQAILNNIKGTKILFEAAIIDKVKNFIIISTDKAVNPTSVMGVTKRITEKLMHYYCNKTEITKFSAVRFGNVLNSNGSVIQTFDRQIEEGEITVTHEDVVRYFMTTGEAVQLVLLCWAQNKGDEIFILDMGEPIKILDLAKLMIRLRGYEPYKDVDIKIVGLRPGEKLFEEPMTSIEQVNATKNKKIYIVKNDEKVNYNDFIVKVNMLINLSYEQRFCTLKSILKDIVPNYNELLNYGENTYDC